jgi:benzoate transport
MSRFQWIVVAVMIGLNALDGFDVLSISFASPGIAKDWGIDRGALGLVLSMELIGMAIGSLLLGGAADRFGRRGTILACLVAMACGMFGAATAHDVVTLSFWRVGTGMGIGGMLAATNAAVAEVANARRRSLVVVLMAGGYPIGTIVGGMISAALLANHDWRAVFVFGGAATLCFIPLVILCAPESIAFLAQRGGGHDLARINRILGRMGHPPLDGLTPPDAPSAGSRAAELFSGRRALLTVLLTIAYLAHIMTFYFILKWIPKIVVDFGFEPSRAAGVLVWASVGGAIGSLTLGLLTLRIRVLGLTVAAMLLSAALVVLFGHQHGSLSWLSLTGAIAGFATNAGVVGIYALLAQAYPTRLRASATGFVIGIGRGGSALAPALAGWLFVAGFGLPTVSVLMGMGSLVAAAALVAARRGLSGIGRSGIEPAGSTA